MQNMKDIVFKEGINVCPENAIQSVLHCECVKWLIKTKADLLHETNKFAVCTINSSNAALGVNRQYNNDKNILLGTT